MLTILGKVDCWCAADPSMVVSGSGRGILVRHRLGFGLRSIHFLGPRADVYN